MSFVGLNIPHGLYESINIAGNELAGSKRGIWTRWDGATWLKEMSVVGNRFIPNKGTDLGGGISGVGCDLGTIQGVAIAGNTFRGPASARAILQSTGTAAVTDVGNVRIGGIS